MAFKELINKVFSGGTKKQMQYAKLLDGYSPVFSQFGQDVYSSDIVQMCIDVIATECSKLQPRHIRTVNDTQNTANTSINRLFKFSPNELMTTRDFIEKIIWLLYANYNAFIYPTYYINNNKREYTGFYPLNPTAVAYLQDSTGKLFVQLDFSNGQRFTLPYSEVIHLRKKFSVNDIMGGGIDGQPDNQALLKVLQINDTVLQGLEKAIKTSLNIRGVIKINTMLDDEAQQQERERFETVLASGTSGLMPLDIKGDYIPLNIDPKIIDKETLEFLQNKVLNYYGVSVPILTGDFTDEQYQAFYEKTLEPLIISLGQAFSKALFSQNELNFGNEIVFYQKNMMYLSTKTKIELLKITGEQGLLTDDQKLALLGYPPIGGEEGKRKTQSLNYIAVDKATEYQMKKAGLKGDDDVGESDS